MKLLKREDKDFSVLKDKHTSTGRH